MNIGPKRTGRSARASGVVLAFDSNVDFVATDGKPVGTIFLCAGLIDLFTFMGMTVSCGPSVKVEGENAFYGVEARIQGYDEFTYTLYQDYWPFTGRINRRLSCVVNIGFNQFGLLGAYETLAYSHTDPVIEGPVTRGYPQYGYRADNVDPDGVHYYPFKNGDHSSWMLYTEMTYGEEIEIGTQWYASVTLSMSGQSPIVYTRTGTMPATTPLDYQMKIAMRANRVRNPTLGMLGSDPNAVMSIRMPLRNTYTSMDDLDLSNPDVTAVGTAQTLTINIQPPADAAPASSENNYYLGYDAVHNPFGAVMFPDWNVLIEGRVAQLGGGNWPGNVNLRSSMDWDGNTFVNGYPDFVSASPIETITNGVHSRTRALARHTVHCETNGTALRSYDFSRDQQQPLGVFIDEAWLALNVQDASQWRILLQDPVRIAPWTMQAVSSSAVETFSETLGTTPFVATGGGSLAGGGGTLTINAGAGGTAGMSRNCLASGDELLKYDWHNYRYLVVRASASQAMTITLSLTSREWDTGLVAFRDVVRTYDVALSTSMSDVRIDLCSPKTITGGAWLVDTTDFSTAATVTAIGQFIAQLDDPQVESATDTINDFVPGRYYGVGRVKTLAISGVSASQSATFDAISLSIAEPTDVTSARLSILPTVQQSKINGDSARSWSDYDVTFNPSPARYHPEGKRALFTLINSKQAADERYAFLRPSYYLNTDFTSLTGIYSRLIAAPGWTITNLLYGNGVDPLGLRDNTKYLAGWLSNVIWPDDARSIAGGSLTYVYDRDVLVQPFVPYARIHADRVSIYPGIGDPSIPNDPAASYPVLYAVMLGAGLHGLTFDSNGVAASNVTVTVKEGATTRDTKTSDARDYYRTSALLRSKITNMTGSTSAASANWTANARRLVWLGIVGAIPTPVSVDASIDDFRKARMIGVVSSADGGLVLRLSNDLGTTWSVFPITGSTGCTRPDIALCGDVGSELWAVVARSDSGNLLLFRNASDGGDALSVTIDSAVSDIGPRVTWLRSRRLLVVTYSKSGTARSVVCNNVTASVPTFGSPVTMTNSEQTIDVVEAEDVGQIIGVYRDASANLKLIKSGSDGADWLVV